MADAPLSIRLHATQGKSTEQKLERSLLFQNKHRTESAERSELAALFAAAIRRLLEREALTSPISPKLSASRLDVRTQTRLNGRHG